MAVVALAGAASVSATDASVAAFVGQHCVDCHGESDPEGGFGVDALVQRSGEEALADRDLFRAWAMVHDRVSKGLMPPPDAEQPTEVDKDRFLSALGRDLVVADRKRVESFGRSELRRLSRSEYANSVKDILDLPHLELEEMLPPDGLADGYPKSSQALDFSHVMVSRYLEAADVALWKALARRSESLPRKVIRAELKSIDGVTDTLQTLRVQIKQTTAMPLVGKDLDPTLESTMGNFQKRDPGYVRDPPPHFDGVATFMNSRSNHNIVVKPFKVRQSGYYKLRVNGWGLVNDHGELLPSDRTETVAFYSPTGRLLGRCDLPPNEPTTSEATVWLNEDEPIEYLAISTPQANFSLGGKLRPNYLHFKSYGIGLRWFEMEGPFTGPVPPPKQRGDVNAVSHDDVQPPNVSWPPESHRRLLGDMKLIPTDRQPNGLEYRVETDDPVGDARRLLRRFAARVYRRPPRDEDVLIPMTMVRPRLRRGEPFIDALLAGYRAILTSPEFLLLNEQPGELNAWQLANRLSYFLWNSPPDEGLLEVAESGRLLEDAELREQTNRMLDDPKSQRFIAHFLDYWLDLRQITLTEPDGSLYPEYNALLGESMVEETHAFFTAMIREDLGAGHVIDSDFLTINQRMAQVYGIDGVHGTQTRKVALPPDTVRGGLLTQGSLLKITANGTTTSPVVRGTFAMSRLLGDPPPPPPAAVAAIEPDISGATTIREQLAKHRSDPACASCHQKIDPSGFALESFDVMGALRDRYRASVRKGERGVKQKFAGKPAQFKLGLPVDPAGQLADGTPFGDINEFRERLKPSTPQIARNLLQQFIVYGTGAPVGFADEALVAEMMDRLGERRYGVRSMIHEVVQSELFRNK